MMTMNMLNTEIPRRQSSRSSASSKNACAFALRVLSIPIVCVAALLPGPAWGATGDDEGNDEQAARWRIAEGAWPWSFPRDHGAHPDFQTEWWYFTGHLQDEAGRTFGFQLTFFRFGAAWKPVQPQSRWSLRDFHFGHFAVSDVARTRFHHFSRSVRPFGNLTVYSREKMELSLKDWTVTQTGPDQFALSAAEDGIRLSLSLVAAKPMVFHGPDGLSTKGEGAGNASHYYSYPRLAAAGELSIEGDRHRVSGTAWFDHEFSTSALAPGQLGWDWFSIQLDSGEELMVYQMRRDDGSIDRHSHGTWVDAAGAAHPLARDDFRVAAMSSWSSPDTVAIYPLDWTVTVPSLDLRLRVTPAFRRQEMVSKGDGQPSYWEGACEVSGSLAGRPRSGRAYVEMTGYADSLAPAMGEIR